MGDKEKWIIRNSKKKVWNELRYVNGFVKGGK
jgi:hypothetical protein